MFRSKPKVGVGRIRERATNDGTSTQWKRWMSGFVFGCRCAPSRAGWWSTRRGAGRFARARRRALYRETYLHDRHVHDGLHPLDAAHGRLGHGAREIDRSVASRAKRPNAECPGNARGSSGERATFGPTRRGARGGVARATGSRWSPEKRPDDWRRCVRDRAFMARAKRTLLQRNLAVRVFAHTKLEATCSVTASIRRSTPTHRRQTRRRLGALAPPRHSHRAEPPKGLDVRPPRPASFRAMRRLGASTPLRASPARESPIVARVVRAIGRG